MHSTHHRRLLTYVHSTTPAGMWLSINRQHALQKYFKFFRQHLLFHAPSLQLLSNFQSLFSAPSLIFLHDSRSLIDKSDILIWPCNFLPSRSYCWEHCSHGAATANSLLSPTRFAESPLPPFQAYRHRRHLRRHHHRRQYHTRAQSPSHPQSPSVHRPLITR
jgi:hypothetical protein